MYPRALRRRVPALATFVPLLVFAAHATIARAEPFTFGVIGDYGLNNTAERDVANLVKSWNPSFILTLGDNNYSTDPTSWDARIGQYYHQYIYNYKGTYGPGSPTRRFFPNIGNHDYDAGIQGYLDYFDLPGNERYYTYRHGPVEFFVLNSNSQEPDGISKTSKQAAWLQSAMAASDAKWKIVSLHHPPYASGSASTTMRWPFEEWGADVVMAGHLHNYERLHIGNIDYFINGLGGAGISGFGTTATGSQVRYNDSHGAMKVIADDSFMRFQLINKAGQVIDDYTIGTVLPTPVIRNWNTAVTTGAWNVAGNWSPSGVPSAGSDVLLVQQDATNRTVSYANASGANTQLKSLTVEGRSTGTITLRQSQDTLNVLSLNIATTSGSNGAFDKTGGTLVAEQVVNRGMFNHAGGTMQVAETFQNTGGVAAIAGDHRWGAGATISVSGGAVHLNSRATTDASNGLTLDVAAGGSARINASQRLKSLVVNGGDVTFASGGGIVLKTDALTIGNGGSLDLADNALIVRSTATTQANDLGVIESLVAAGRNGGASLWAGEGITASAASAGENTTLAVVPNPGLAAFNGEAVSPHDILIGYTWNGDANLDGKVNADDYFLIDNGALAGKRGFANGDFNYDGKINADDYFLIDSVFLVPAASAGFAPSAVTVATVAMNPEPAMLPLVLSAWTLGLRRRGR